MLHTRLLWTFSAAWARFGDSALRDAAGHALAFLRERLVDPAEGGLFWAVAADGAVIDPRKILYGQGFAIYGLAAHHRATGETASLDLARDVFDLIERRCALPTGGGYHETFTADWRPLDRGPVGRPGAAWTLNTHLHLLEAYDDLLRAWPDPLVGDRVAALFDRLMRLSLDPRRNTFRERFAADGRPMDQGGSYGHDIEAAWLMGAIAERLGRAPPAVLAGVARQVLARAVGPDGGVAYAARGWGRTDRRRVWWVQAEALVGFLDAFERTGEPRFLDAAEALWAFIDRAVADRAVGDWRETVEPGGRPGPASPRASAWKCPYHNARACLELVARAERYSRAD